MSVDLTPNSSKTRPRTREIDEPVIATDHIDVAADDGARDQEPAKKKFMSMTVNRSGANTNLGIIKSKDQAHQQMVSFRERVDTIKAAKP